ncbi:MAG: RNA 2',3'-cyclic phosphodiesterase [Chloroflexota bacterium]
MSLLRTFIAVEIPPDVQKQIQTATESLRKEAGSSLVRWVPMHNMHLTLKFLGDVSPASVDQLTEIIRTEADTCPAFDLQINGLGSFPSLKRPRVLWVGIQAPAELEALYRGIESACARLGYESEGRDFSPHLTLGRVKQDASAVDQQRIRRALEETKIDSLGTARVNSVHLYKSDLKPSGSVYTQIFSALLKP